MNYFIYNNDKITYDENVPKNINHYKLSLWNDIIYVCVKFKSEFEYHVIYNLSHYDKYSKYCQIAEVFYKYQDMYVIRNNSIIDVGWSKRLDINYKDIDILKAKDEIYYINYSNFYLYGVKKNIIDNIIKQKKHIEKILKIERTIYKILDKKGYITNAYGLSLDFLMQDIYDIKILEKFSYKEIYNLLLLTLINLLMKKEVLWKKSKKAKSVLRTSQD
jgi:hypothetical protein